MEKWLFLILIILIIINFSGCVQTSIIQDFKFNSGEGGCAEKLTDIADIKLEDNKIIFSGFITTPTPCYELKASYSIDKIEFAKAPTTDVITITIIKEPVGDVCIQCIGEISFNGELTINREMWNSGHYGVEIIHDGKELTRLYSYVA